MNDTPIHDATDAELRAELRRRRKPHKSAGSGRGRPPDTKLREAIMAVVRERWADGLTSTTGDVARALGRDLSTVRYQVTALEAEGRLVGKRLGRGRATRWRPLVVLGARK